MAKEIRTSDPRGLNKGRSSKFRVGSRVRQTPEGNPEKIVEITIKMKTIVRKPLIIKSEQMVLKVLLGLHELRR